MEVGARREPISAVRVSRGHREPDDRVRGARTAPPRIGHGTAAAFLASAAARGASSEGWARSVGLGTAHNTETRRNVRALEAFGWPMRHHGSYRSRLRAFQTMRGEPPDSGFIADLEFLENRDLDLSIRLGAMLAFNALLITIGTHPVSASPGAPLSLDAATQPVLTLSSLFGIAPIIFSSWFCLRALLVGEEFDGTDLEHDEALRQRLFASFVRSIDAQSMLLRRAVRCTLAGSIATLALWAAILATKMS